VEEFQRGAKAATPAVAPDETRPAPAAPVPAAP
jgi:hypothetical protein